MIWKVEFDDRARKELRRLDRQAQRGILAYLRNRIATHEDPRRFGDPLRKNLSGFWKYRVGQRDRHSGTHLSISLCSK
ncbi:type II toxin-antitoxin system RelE family toxin [Desulfonatronovibrio magnus]|uniref:type II toxin-antitoxin system RelE family toxin n=1 Tax=Desulfonatronovibrio magnus TaxID=698827 RepID=UPI0005EBED9E|nr:type II toxin-antitoxin system RelE/ParE family toxin [Desulfonatronovibrio magnus]